MAVDGCWSIWTSYNTPKQLQQVLYVAKNTIQEEFAKNCDSIVCVKDWGCVKDQSETVVISQARRGHKKGEMAPFLDGGCQKYGRPLGPATQCGRKLISPDKEMVWARIDWTCENKHLNLFNLFNLHSKVEISAVKCSQVGSSP